MRSALVRLILVSSLVLASLPAQGQVPAKAPLRGRCLNEPVTRPGLIRRVLTSILHPVAAAAVTAVMDGPVPFRSFEQTVGGPPVDNSQFHILFGGNIWALFVDGLNEQLRSHGNTGVWAKALTAAEEPDYHLAYVDFLREAGYTPGADGSAVTLHSIYRAYARRMRRLVREGRIAEDRVPVPTLPLRDQIKGRLVPLPYSNANSPMGSFAVGPEHSFRDNFDYIDFIARGGFPASPSVSNILSAPVHYGMNMHDAGHLVGFSLHPEAADALVGHCRRITRTMSRSDINAEWIKERILFVTEYTEVINIPEGHMVRDLFAAPPPAAGAAADGVTYPEALQAWAHIAESEGQAAYDERARAMIDAARGLMGNPRFYSPFGGVAVDPFAQRLAANTAQPSSLLMSAIANAEAGSYQPTQMAQVEVYLRRMNGVTAEETVDGLLGTVPDRGSSHFLERFCGAGFVSGAGMVSGFSRGLCP